MVEGKLTEFYYSKELAEIQHANYNQRRDLAFGINWVYKDEACDSTLEHTPAFWLAGRE